MNRTTKSTWGGGSTCAGVLLWATCFALTTPGAAAARGHYRRCRPPSFHFPGDTLSERDSSCRTARHVIEAFSAEAQSAGPDVRVLGFHCVAVADRGGEPAITCRRGDARVVLHGSQG